MEFIRVTSSLLASLILFPAITLADKCPEPREIVRSPGEYSWFSNVPGWEGGFQYPLPGSGHSTRLSSFREARWVQVTNMPNGLGYVVCDYQGNYDDEIIRFTQIREDVTKRPTSINWICKIKTDYPSTACTCSGLAGQCTF